MFMLFCSKKLEVIWECFIQFGPGLAMDTIALLNYLIVSYLV